MLKLAVGIGGAASFLMLARLVTGGAPVPYALFAVVFLALSAGAFAALRRKVWRTWFPRQIPHKQAMGLFILVGVGSIGLYIWAILGGVAISGPLAWWESLPLVVIGAALLATACLAGYRNLVRQGVIV